MISVIIPTLNEREYLPRVLDNLRIQSVLPDEILIVDAGSQDGTQQVASANGLRLISSERPVAKQMNLGAKESSGHVLLFLHADCALEQHALADLVQLMNKSEAIAGAFRLQLQGNRRWLDQYLSWSGTWNARHSQIYLGDHGIFCRRAIFQEVGGFPEIDLMYEFEFMRKLRSRGELVQLNKKCFASARRFQKNGYWKTIFLMRSLRTFYRLGLPTARIERMYQCNGERTRI